MVCMQPFLHQTRASNQRFINVFRRSVCSAAAAAGDVNRKTGRLLGHHRRRRCYEINQWKICIERPHREAVLHLRRRRRAPRVGGGDCGPQEWPPHMPHTHAHREERNCRLFTLFWLRVRLMPEMELDERDYGLWLPFWNNKLGNLQWPSADWCAPRETVIRSDPGIEAFSPEAFFYYWVQIKEIRGTFKVLVMFKYGQTLFQYIKTITLRFEDVKNLLIVLNWCLKMWFSWFFHYKKGVPLFDRKNRIST